MPNKFNIEKIHDGTQLTIENQNYSVLGMAQYKTHDGATYYKIFLSDNHIICFDTPNDNILEFGHEISPLGYKAPFSNEIKYGGEIYSLEISAHQILQKKFFGIVESDCDFWDYKNDGRKISIGILCPSKERADVEIRMINKNLIQITKI